MSAGLTFAVGGVVLCVGCSGRGGWWLERLGQGAMDRLEVEVALGHPCRDGVGARGTDSGGDILEDYRLEARLAGIVRHQFGAIPCDGRLALGVQRRRDHEQPAVVIVAPLEHRGDEQLLAPELLDRRVTQGRCVRIAEDAGRPRQCVVAWPLR